jgi:hypothetical protein
MTAIGEVGVGSRWRHRELVYEIRALRPIEPGCRAWGARQLVLATPEGEDPHPLDWIADTWLRRYWIALGDEHPAAAA